jgi:predicted transcriptional regulator
MTTKPKSERIVINDELLAKVKTLAAFGLTDEQIAVLVGVSEMTIRRRAAKQLKEGRLTASVKVIESAYKQAVSGKCPAMTMFWLKCRMRWRETDRENDNDDEKLAKVKEAVKDIVAALNQAKQPPEAKP